MDDVTWWTWIYLSQSQSHAAEEEENKRLVQCCFCNYERFWLQFLFNRRVGKRFDVRRWPVWAVSSEEAQNTYCQSASTWLCCKCMHLFFVCTYSPTFLLYIFPTTTISIFIHSHNGHFIYLFLVLNKKFWNSIFAYIKN